MATTSSRREELLHPVDASVRPQRRRSGSGLGSLVQVDLALAQIDCGLYDVATAALDRAEALIATRGLAGHMGAALWARGTIAHLRGDLEGAETRYAEACALRTGGGWRQAVRAFRAALWTELGRSEAIEALEVLVADSARQHMGVRPMASAYLALAHVRNGEVTAAQEVLGAVAEPPLGSPEAVLVAVAQLAVDVVAERAPASALAARCAALTAQTATGRCRFNTRIRVGVRLCTILQHRERSAPI